MNISSKLKTLVIFFVCFVIGFSIAKALFHPWPCFQLPMPANYSEYELAQMAYDRYEEKYDKKPHDLSFLPQDMAADIGKPGYSITYDAKTRNLEWKASSPYYLNRRDLIDYIFNLHSSKITGASIGPIEQVEPAPGNAQDPASTEK